MATLKQQRAVKEILENPSIPVSKAMRKAGYSEAMARQPHELTKSKGFMEEMAAYGLTKELIAGSLVDDIKNKPGERAQEINIGSKILRMQGDRLDITTNGKDLLSSFTNEKVETARGGNELVSEAEMETE